MTHDSGSENPYAPPAAAQEGWTPSPPPGPPATPTSAPKVFGILSIIFGSLIMLTSLLSSCVGFAGQGMSSLGHLAPRDDAQSRMMQDALREMGSIYTIMGLQGLVLVAMSALLLAIGIGQLRYRRWAASWSVYWGGLALVVLVAMTVVSFLVIGPAYQKFFDAVSRASPTGAIPMPFTSSMGKMMGGGSAAIMGIFYAPYPILMLYFFTRENIHAAMDR
jgi:hypothetical protein